LISVLGVLIFILILAALLIPGQIVSSLARSEAIATESLHALTTLNSDTQQRIY
jgi:hypothetical protein